MQPRKLATSAPGGPKGTATPTAFAYVGHTCATLLIYEGRPINEVAEHLGHADAGFTLRVYAHTFSDASKRRRVPMRGDRGRARDAWWTCEPRTKGRRRRACK